MGGHVTLPQVKQRTGIIIAGRRAGGQAAQMTGDGARGAQKPHRACGFGGGGAANIRAECASSEAVRPRHREARDAGPHGLWHPQRRREAAPQDRVDGRLGCASRSPSPSAFIIYSSPKMSVFYNGRARFCLPRLILTSSQRAARTRPAPSWSAHRRVFSSSTTSFPPQTVRPLPPRSRLLISC